MRNPNENIVPSADESIERMSQSSKVAFASRLADWFSIDLTIKLFDHVIYHLHYPPEKK